MVLSGPLLGCTQNAEAPLQWYFNNEPILILLSRLIMRSNRFMPVRSSVLLKYERERERERESFIGNYP